MWMKMFMASPNFENNTSNVRITFEQALELIKTMDGLTQGIQKIVYLVGWQGLGHDDCYLESQKINEYLKRDCDATARDSFLWLYEEAKKYHTVISVHSNVADEFSACALHDEYVATGSIVKNPDGTPAPIEVFNGRDAYKVSYKQFWESGLFHTYWNTLCETLPIREAGTLHLDNFCIAESFCPRTDVEEQDAARNAILDFIHEQGVDVTSEYPCRELPFRGDYSSHPIRANFYAKHVAALPSSGDWSKIPSRMMGRVPATWWTSHLTLEDCMNTPASVCSGHLVGPLGEVFYGAMHAEDIWINRGIRNEDWVPSFIREFCTYQVPYFYLNRHDRLTAEEIPDGGYAVTHSEGVVSNSHDHTISKNGVILKRDSDVILPLTEDNRLFVAYSDQGRAGKWPVPDAAFTEAEVFEMTADGNRPLGACSVIDGEIELEVKPGQGIVIRGI
jgi:hypothetical protein